MREAFLIANGFSAEGYQAPGGIFTVTINGGFRTHRCDAAFSVDCPSDVQDAWVAFTGRKITADHTPGYRRGSDGRKDERFTCGELVRQYGSATPCALDWLRKEGFTKATVVGLDSLWGAGKPGAEYNSTVLEMVYDMARRFPDGLLVRLECGAIVRVDSPEFPFNPGQIVAAKKLATAPEVRSKIPGPARGCKIPQTMVEFDVSPKCTRACSFCAPGISPARRKQKRGLSLEAHNAVIDELAALNYDGTDRWLCYCGHGEPTMCPDLVPMLRYARKMLPDCKIAVYTNGDLLTVELCCAFEASDVDALVWDVYDADIAKSVPPIIAASSLDPERVHVVDHVGQRQSYSSRCSSVKPGDVAEWQTRPCAMPEGKLFVTDGPKGGAAALLCCEDYARESLTVLNGVASLVDNAAPIRRALAVGKRAEATPICSKCDRDGGHPNGFAHVPKLATFKHLWPVKPELPEPKGTRLVVLATNAEWAAHAALALDVIANASTMQGETVLIYNDTKPCPPELKRPGVTLWEYPQMLGWCGINRGFARAFKYALDKGHSWVIKLDTDTAIIRKGWDALICDATPTGAQSGTYMDASLVGTIPDNRDKYDDGLFNRQLATYCRWARRMVDRKARKWDHVQGGCYCIGAVALARIDRVVGLDAPEQEPGPDSERVGEDVYIDTKCKLARVPQIDSMRFRIWFRADKSSLKLDHVRYQRDALGVAVVHPIKDLDTLRLLAGEI